MKKIDYNGQTVIIEKGKPYWVRSNGDKELMTKEEQIQFRIWKEDNVYAKRTHEIIKSHKEGKKIERAIKNEKFKQRTEQIRKERRKNRKKYTREKEEQITNEWTPPFAYNDDNKVIEIWGYINNYRMISPEVVEIEILDYNGNSYRAILYGKSRIYNTVKRLYPPSIKQMIKTKDIPTYLKIGTEEKKILLWRLIKKEYVKEVIPHIYKEPNHPFVFATLTNRFKKFTISDFKNTDMYNQLIEKFEHIKVKDNDGISGGKIELEYKSIIDLGTPKITIDFGYIGDNSVRLYSSFSILSCSNQLTFIGSTLIENNYTISFTIKKRHTKNLDLILEDINYITSSIDSIEHLIDISKSIELNQDDVEIFFKYNLRHNKMSIKTIKRIKNYLNVDEITKYPNTLYGLIMVLSFIATHDNVKSGVRWNLSGLSGELLLVSPNWRDYLKEMIKDMTRQSAPNRQE